MSSLLWLQDPAAAPKFGGLLPDAFVFAVFDAAGLGCTCASQPSSICWLHLFIAFCCGPSLLQPSSAYERDGADRTVHGSFLSSGRLSFLLSSFLSSLFLFSSVLHQILHLHAPLNHGVQGAPTSPPADYTGHDGAQLVSRPWRHGHWGSFLHLWLRCRRS